MLAVMLITTSMVVPVMAGVEDATEILQSDLIDASKIHKLSGFELTAWAYKRCGYSSSRNIYYNAGTDSDYLIFDAGEGKEFYGDQTFKVTVHNNEKDSILKDNNRKDMFLVSDDGINFKMPDCVSDYTDAVVAYEGSTPYYTHDVTWKLTEGYKYVKIKPAYDMSGWNFFIHGVTLKGGNALPKVLLDNTLETNSAISSMSGFYQPDAFGDWPWGNCGYSSSRSLYANAGTGAAEMIFDVGADKMATEASFLVSADGSTWHIDNANSENTLYDKLKVSNDGINWTAVKNPGVADETQSGGYMTKLLTWSIPDGCRYVKLYFNGFAAPRHVFVHHVTLKGFNEAPEYSYTDDLVTNTTATFTNIQRVDWTSGTQDTPYWVLKDAGIDTSVRQSAMATEASTKGYITFYSGEDTLFSGADMRVTARNTNDKWLINTEAHYKNYWEYSTDGATWINPASTTGTSLSTNTYIHSIKLPAPARYVRYHVYELYKDMSGVFHSANLYTTGPNIQFKENPAITKSGTTVTATGNVINKAAAKSNVNVILAVYEGDKLVGAGVSSFASLAPGENAYNADADISAATSGATLTTKVFVWDSNDLTPIMPYVPTK